MILSDAEVARLRRLLWEIDKGLTIQDKIQALH